MYSVEAAEMRRPLHDRWASEHLLSHPSNTPSHIPTNTPSHIPLIRLLTHLLTTTKILISPLIPPLTLARQVGQYNSPTHPIITPPLTHIVTTHSHQPSLFPRPPLQGRAAHPQRLHASGPRRLPRPKTHGPGDQITPPPPPVYMMICTFPIWPDIHIFLFYH